VATVLRAPYYRTLWTYYHLQQHDRIDELRERGRALHLGGLMAFAFNDPKKLRDEHQRLLVDAGMVPTVDTSREQALALIADVERVDKAGGWIAKSEAVS
jgi:hypothetical protein